MISIETNTTSDAFFSLSNYLNLMLTWVENLSFIFPSPAISHLPYHMPSRFFRSAFPSDFPR